MHHASLCQRVSLGSMFWVDTITDQTCICTSTVFQKCKITKCSCAEKRPAKTRKSFLPTSIVLHGLPHPWEQKQARSGSIPDVSFRWLPCQETASKDGLNMGVSKIWGYPTMDGFFFEKPSKMDDLGVHPFSETSICQWSFFLWHPNFESYCTHDFLIPLACTCVQRLSRYVV